MQETTSKFCITCGKLLKGKEQQQYCCDLHEEGFQQQARKNGRYPITSKFSDWELRYWQYDRETGRKTAYARNNRNHKPL